MSGYEKSMKMYQTVEDRIYNALCQVMDLWHFAGTHHMRTEPLIVLMDKASGAAYIRTEHNVSELERGVQAAGKAYRAVYMDLREETPEPIEPVDHINELYRTLTGRDICIRR